MQIGGNAQVLMLAGIQVLATSQALARNLAEALIATVQGSALASGLAADSAEFSQIAKALLDGESSSPP